MTVLYEDNHLLFAQKPPNVPSQADSSGDPDMLSLVKDYIKKTRNKPGEAYVALVHRLDRPVGGVMLFCKTSKAASRVSDMIRRNQMEKKYFAVVQGELSGSERLSDHIIKDESSNTSRICAPDTPGAKECALRYEALRCADGLTLVAVRLETGRSHQIRVQMANRGHALYGDSRYGGGRPGQQIALWAHEISLKHPVRDEIITVSSNPPENFPWTCFF